MIVLGAVSLFIAGLIDQKPYKLVDHTYAVTNKRLLYGSTKKMESLPLENIPAITLIERTQQRGILSFGGLYLLWPEMEDAAQVKSIIEDAQKQRVQALPLS